MIWFAWNFGRVVLTIGAALTLNTIFEDYGYHGGVLRLLLAMIVGLIVIRIWQPGGHHVDREGEED